MQRHLTSLELLLQRSIGRISRGLLQKYADVARLKDNADALTVKIKRDVTGDISVTNLRENGSLTNEGNLAAAGNIALSAQGTLSQAENTIFTAGKDVKLTSAAADIKQAENAGIEATKVTTTSAKTVDLLRQGRLYNSWGYYH